MGRQLQFYMLPEDQNAFLRHVQERDSIVVAARSSDSAEIQPLPDLEIAGGKTLCLWNPNLLQNLERQWIPEPRYYTVDVLKTPTLEFTPSFTATWEDQPALGQGRLFGNFEPYLKKPREFEKWFESLVRWIRKNYQKNPVGLGGYVAPAALEFYKNGGYLLPNFLPPRTDEWVTIIGKQH
jgi:hypothetical protein